MDGADLHLANAALTVSVSQQGGVLGAATAGGLPFLRPSQGLGPTDSACFPMVPLCNRVAGNRFVFAGQEYRLAPNSNDPFYLHGDGWLTEWEVSQSSRNQAVLRFTHTSGPFHYEAQETIRLDGTTLHLHLSVRNTGTEAMPFGLGFHPYFPREGAELQFTADSRWSEGSGHLPRAVGSIPPDVDFVEPRPLPKNWQNNAYGGWQGKARIHWRHQGISLELQADPLFDSLMLYAPDTDDSYFCVEPMSHLPNTLNMPGQPGLHVLAPDHTLAGGIRMTITTTEPQL